MTARLVAGDLDRNAARDLLVTRYQVAVSAAGRMLTAALDTGSFKTPGYRVTRISISPERFAIYERPS